MLLWSKRQKAAVSVDAGASMLSRASTDVALATCHQLSACLVVETATVQVALDVAATNI